MRRFGRSAVVGMTFIFGLAVAGQAVAQEEPAPVAVAPVKAEPLPQNSIHVEGLGAGVLFSFNYERLLPKDLAVRVGFAYIGMGGTETDPDTGTTVDVNVGLFSIPITVSWLGLRSSNNVHMLELGLGATVVGLTASASVDIPLAGSLFGAGATATALPHFVVGYRLQAGAFQFRTGFTPLINPDGGVVPLPHMSFGASF